MFNLAKKRIAQKFQQEELVFNAKPEPQRLQEDATSLSRLMARDGIFKAEDMIAQQMNVEYWQYVREYHPDYLKKVMHEAEILAKQFAHDFKANPEKYPMPAPQQGGQGGGGGGGAMGGTEKRTIKSFVLPDGTVLVRQG